MSNGKTLQSSNCLYQRLLHLFCSLIVQVHPKSIHVTAVLLEYTTRTNRETKGVCTSWLYTKQPEGLDQHSLPRVPIYVRKSQFRLPFKPTTPVVMIGPGTGLAPFRGFIQERSFYKESGWSDNTG